MSALLGKLEQKEYLYDFSVSGGAASTISLSTLAGEFSIPAGAVIKSVFMKVVTTFTSGGSATLAWGPTSDTDGYSGTAIAVASLTANSVFNGWDNGAALLWDDTNDHAIFPCVVAANTGDFNVVIGTAAMTAGKAVFVVEYYSPAVDL